MSLPERHLVKICGLSSEETLRAALEAGADMVGLVFFEKSPRHVSLAQARALASLARGRAAIVALTVNAGDGEIDAIRAGVQPDLFQLHGSETPERVRAVADRTGAAVMKALGVSSVADLAAAPAYAAVGARLLLDAKPPKDAVLPGGNGATFDWSILEKLDPSLAFMLSGGLDPANVARAIEIARPAGVDVSSGVESAPGVKDISRIKAFVAQARVGFASLEAPRP